MRNTKPAAILFTTAMLASAVAVADEPMGKVGHIDGDTPGHHYRVKGSFGHADQNDDGKITREEWFTESEHVFERLDENGDRTLSEDEFKILPMVRDLP